MNKNYIKIFISINDLGKRIDKVLSKKIDNFSRNKIQDLIINGNIMLDKVIIKDQSLIIKKECTLLVNLPKPKDSKLVAKKIDLEIFYEDENLLVLNKKAGIIVHPGAGNYENTIVNGLLYKYQNKLSSVGGRLRPGIVHRIDKDTSGVIVVAKNDDAHINLSRQFSEHSIKRTYEAIIWGSLKPQSGTIREKISRSTRNRQLMTVRKEKGKIAITNYRTLKIFQNSNLPKISLIECQLETGRTHQIRVHMNFKGNPILGDRSYGKTKKKFKKIDANLEKKINNFNRQALHAKSLGFIHPKTKKEEFFEATRPNDFEALIKKLKKASI